MKYVLFCFFLMSMQLCHSQPSKIKNLTNAHYDSNLVLQTLKDIALCKCIENGYALDSLGIKDPSAWILIGTVNCDLDPLFALDSLTKKFVDTLPTLVKGADYENLIHKRIMSSCIEFYKSKRLEDFIKRLIEESCNISPSSPKSTD